jgi:arylsulfatase A
MVRYTDKMVGRVMAQVEASGLADNTFVLFTADNGSLGNTVSEIKGRSVRGGKGQTTNAGTHVPLVVAGPAVVSGEVNHDLIDFSDFLPTLCEMAGVKPHPVERFNGQSFLPQLEGKAGAPREFIYCWYEIPNFMKRRYPGMVDVSFARNARYKLYRNGDFYDLEKDELEEKPLDAAEYGAELAALRLKMKTLLRQHDTARPK